jgi:hypothetical protein
MWHRRSACERQFVGLGGTDILSVFGKIHRLEADATYRCGSRTLNHSATDAGVPLASALHPRAGPHSKSDRCNPGEDRPLHRIARLTLKSIGDTRLRRAGRVRGYNKTKPE